MSKLVPNCVEIGIAWEDNGASVVPCATTPKRTCFNGICESAIATLFTFSIARLLHIIGSNYVYSDFVRVHVGYIENLMRVFST